MAKQNNLAELQQLIADFIKERDWNQFHTPKNLSMKIAIEAAELMEKFTWIDSSDSYKELDTNRQEIEDEFADVLIVALAFANQCNIDITAAVKHKLEEVKQKYPVEKVKGKYFKYTQYK